MQIADRQWNLHQIHLQACSQQNDDCTTKYHTCLRKSISMLISWINGGLLMKTQEMVLSRLATVSHLDKRFHIVATNAVNYNHNNGKHVKSCALLPPVINAFLLACKPICSHKGKFPTKWRRIARTQSAVCLFDSKKSSA